MADKHAATYHGSDLQRRRELAGMTKAELIDWILQIEAANHAATRATTALRERVEGYEP